MSKRLAEEPTDLLPIDLIKVGKRFRQHMGDIDALAASIREHGLLHPVVVTPERTLIAGERRLLAVRRIGWTDVPVRVVAPRDLLRAETDENTARLDFTPSEAVAVAEALRPNVEAEAKERIGGRPSKTGGNLPQVSGGKTRDRIAAAVGMSSRTLEKATDVVRAVEADPELAPIADEMDRTGNVDAAFRQVRAVAPPSAALATRAAVMDSDARVQEAAARVRWAGVMRRLGELLTFPPEQYVGLLDAGTVRSLAAQVSDARAWLERIDVAVADTSGLKVVGGTR